MTAGTVTPGQVLQRWLIRGNRKLHSVCLCVRKSITLHNLCYVRQPGVRTGVAQPLLSCCPNTTPAMATNTLAAYSWYGTLHQSLWVLQMWNCCNLTCKNTDLVVVVGVSLAGRLCRPRCLLAGRFSIHDVQKCLFIHWIEQRSNQT